LGDIERALNATHNSTTGTSADRLWSREKQAINDPEKLKSQIRQQDRAVRLIDKFNALQFKTGDNVRMLMSSIFFKHQEKGKTERYKVSGCQMDAPDIPSKSGTTDGDLRKTSLFNCQ
jgi:hypothetical protein